VGGELCRRFRAEEESKVGGEFRAEWGFKAGWESRVKGELRAEGKLAWSIGII
jgi:hypothetical protein